jgi:hypothetical protein
MYRPQVPKWFLRLRRRSAVAAAASAAEAVARRERRKQNAWRALAITGRALGVVISGAVVVIFVGCAVLAMLLKGGKR